MSGDGIFQTQPKAVVGDYFTIGAFSPPGKDPSLFVTEINEQPHVHVFLTREAAHGFMAANNLSLEITGWDSLQPLALLMERSSPEISFMQLQQPAGNESEFGAVTITDILDKP